MTSPHPASAARPRIWPPFLLAFAGYAALTVAITFPLVLDLSSRLPKDLGDPLLTASILWWNAHVMPLTERWWNGFGFFPANGMMTFSEHFLGAGLIASPVQWLGASQITAYNLTFLASFPLCGIAAHTLAWTLTRRHDAATVCGLAYAFNPYRVAHLEHLELLLAFGMPAALAALHQFVETRERRWLVAFVAALTIQAFSASYYVLFFTVLLGLWFLWFLRPHAWRDGLAIIASGAAAALLVLPVVLLYSRIQQHYVWRRDLMEEIRRFSADLSSFITASPLSAIWGWTASWNGGERQLFPGLTITALAIGGAILLHQSRPQGRDRLAPVSRTLWVASAAFAAIAIGAAVAGPWRIDWGWLTLSATMPYKPLSSAVTLATIALALGATLRHAFRQRSAFAFYLLAAAVLFACTLGPEPTAWGTRILYEPPYAWLMRLPFFDDTVRVPARFAMLAILALAVAGSLAFHHLTALRRWRGALLCVVCAGIVVDGWTTGVPLPAVPERGYRIPSDERPVAVLELPLGDVWHDTAALYRATLHGTRVVNGYNGFEPIYYQTLRRAIADRDQTVLDALAPFGPLVIAAANDMDQDRSWASFLSSSGLERLDENDDWTLFWLPYKRRDPPRDRCAGDPLGVTAAFDAQGPVNTAMLTDQDPATRWITAHPQRAGDSLVLDLGRVEPLCRLVVSMGSAAVLYPGTLSVRTSFDNATWKVGFVGRMGGPAVRAALTNPRDARISVPLHGEAARYVRLRVRQAEPGYQWAVADVVVEGQR